MKNLKLINGVEIPQVGYGEYLVEKSVCVDNTIKAIKIGYRHIDTANHIWMKKRLVKQ